MSEKLRLAALPEGALANLSDAGTGCSSGSRDGLRMATSQDLEQCVAHLEEQLAKMQRETVHKHGKNIDWLRQHVDSCMEQQALLLDNIVCRHLGWKDSSVRDKGEHVLSREFESTEDTCEESTKTSPPPSSSMKLWRTNTASWAGRSRKIWRNRGRTADLLKDSKRVGSSGTRKSAVTREKSFDTMDTDTAETSVADRFSVSSKAARMASAPTDESRVQHMRSSPTSRAVAASARMRFSAAEEQKMYKANKSLDFEVRKNGQTPRRSLNQFLELPEASVDSQNIIEKLVLTQAFDISCAAVLFANALIIGLQVEDRSTRPSASKDPVSYQVLEYIFTTLFTIELLFRFIGFGPRDFVFGHDRSWNVFDLIVVTTSILEPILTLVLTGGNTNISVLANVSYLRTIRIARVVRVVRVLRLMRFFRSLRVLVTAVFATVKSCIWTSLLLCIILYIFGIVFAQGVADYFETAEATEVALSENTEALRRYFGSLCRSILTCLKSILGGIDWDVAIQALSDCGWFYVFMFIVLILFVYLAVMNVISGLFLQSAIEQAQQDMDNVITQQRQEKEKYRKRFQHVFEEMAHDEEGFIISLQEFEESLGEPLMQGLLQAMDVEASNAWTLFKLLDTNEDGRLSRDEFVEGCLQLKGAARSMQIEQQRYEVKWLMDSINEFAGFCEDSFQELSAQIQRCSSTTVKEDDEVTVTPGSPGSNREVLPQTTWPHRNPTWVAHRPKRAVQAHSPTHGGGENATAHSDDESATSRQVTPSGRRGINLPSTQDEEHPLAIPARSLEQPPVPPGMDPPRMPSPVERNAFEAEPWQLSNLWSEHTRLME